MSDYNSSLPVRTENDGDVVVKVGDATTPSQQLKVLADGSINVNDNGGSITVDGTVELGATTLAALEAITVQNPSGAGAVNIQDGGNSITVDAVDLDTRDLVFATDKVDVSGSTIILDSTSLAALESITIQNPAGAGAVNIQDGGNSITVDGTVSASNFPTTVDTNYGTVGANTIRTASQIGNATGAADFNAGVTGAQTLRTTSNITRNGTELSYNVGASDANTLRTSSLIHDGTDTLAINTDGSVNVVIQEDVGLEIVDYNTAAALASGASSNHDLLFATASKLYQVWGSASGKLKMTVQIETGSATGVFTTKGVGFNSTANPNIEFTLSKYAAIPAGARVRVIRTNLDNQAQDVYSTIVAILG